MKCTILINNNYNNSKICVVIVLIVKIGKLISVIVKIRILISAIVKIGKLISVIVNIKINNSENKNIFINVMNRSNGDNCANISNFLFNKDVNIVPII